MKMKKIGFLALFSIVLAFVACTKKDYTCRCAIDLPETPGIISLDTDTSFTISARLEEEANVQCVAAEEASSFLSSQYDGLDAQIDCGLE